MTSQPRRPGNDVAASAVVTAGAGCALLWLGGCTSALVSGHRAPRGHPLGGVLAFAHPAAPSTAWGSPVGPACVYWITVSAIIGIAVIAVALILRVGEALGIRGSSAGGRSDGMAARRQVQRAAGVRTLLRKGRTLRPSIDKPTATELGYRLGRSGGVECWASVEDSMVALGPPRSGKGLHTVIPAILDAPGAVITTSTRPDNLAATMNARKLIGPVAVFDPQGLADGVPAATRWSPIRGCEVPQVAMARARALCADPGGGVENATFWTQQCYTAVRCLLHAAALGGLQAADLFRWSLSPIAAEEAADILRAHRNAAPAWATALEAILIADPRQRDSTWAMVSNTFAALADPRVLDAISPRPDEYFDPVRFLRERRTLYLLGTATGASATANLVAAFIEDIVESARHLAAASPGARLDPPLAVILDEAANYPLPSLPSLMSEGGGTGITTMVVLQSLAQARAQWGQQEAAAIWDAAIVKLVLGGSGNADDLRDLSALIGTRDDRRVTESWGHDGRKSWSISTQEVPVLDAGRLRTLPFGQAVLLLRSAPPIMLKLQPWTKRKDATAIEAARAEVERTLRVAGEGAVA
jgi:type IV secretion system protein VirD4